ncbi:MAG: YbaB/EbfC family nucleoid-associated protein [Bdellovibrionaceae bacterium]|jgi:nucleoid-associated protein EbfC|nr:YbaB/EbfC family nucleoid-associated protein [Pseudobdellovibrionaceae bacterium]
MKGRGKSFGGGGGSGGMQQIMKQANQMQNKMKKLQEELAEKEFEATSGGGAVKIVVTGNNIVKSVEIDEEIMKDGDAEMLQDMILGATNEALKVAKETNDEEMGKITGGAGIPGMF